MTHDAPSWSAMELVHYRDENFALTQALETDPEVMRHLGGPTDPQRLPETHQRRLEDPWWFTIVAEPSGPAVGSIGIWDHELDGEMISETGWMVLPAFQGRGIATAALALLLARAGAGQVRAPARVPAGHQRPVQRAVS